jgi:SAM-dependent methyltransferase
MTVPTAAARPPSHALPLTGERTLPAIAEENYWFRRHQAAYLQLAQLTGTIRGGRLLEVGAGEGYGAAMLAERAGPVCAIDYDRATISHLAVRYPGLQAVRANLAALPVATGRIDTVVSLQVIEHVWEHRQFLDECARVLRPGGTLILSTPNRLTFSPGATAADRPANLFHSREFTAAELDALVRSAGFGEVRLRGLRAGPRLLRLDEEHRRAGGLVAAQLATPAAAWPDRLRADVRSVTAADFVLAGSDLAGGFDDNLDDLDGLDDLDSDSDNLHRLDDCLDLIVLARWA